MFLAWWGYKNYKERKKMSGCVYPYNKFQSSGYKVENDCIYPYNKFKSDGYKIEGMVSKKVLAFLVIQGLL
ncbi:hypothetical protein [Helicobacter cetorum]|uniref:hypothetical protein n=1 Tax=Helicobacter cetorum TaxID=138563 RepID=UPI001F15AFC5|nr:hypothetical protein [Helicobacter cetorum]